MFRKLVTVTLVLCMAAAGVFATGESESGEPEVLRVGLLPFAGSVPAAYADDQGWFEEAGLNLQFDTFPTGAPMNEAFAASRIDVAIIGLAGVFAMASGDATTVLDTNAVWGNGVYVHPDSPIAQESGNVPGKPKILGSVETIRGKTFLTQLGTGSQNMLFAYLAEFGLTDRDVNVVHMETGQDYQALMARQADASALMNPYSMQAESEGLVRLAQDEQVMPYMAPDVLLVRNPVMAARRVDIVTFVREYIRAAEALSADDQLRYSFSDEYYKQAGREYTDAALKQDIVLRPFITPEYMLRPNYRFGEGMYKTGEFFVGSGRIVPENLDNILTSLDPSVVKDAIDFDIPVYDGK